MIIKTPQVNTSTGSCEGCYYATRGRCPEDDKELLACIARISSTSVRYFIYVEKKEV